VFGSLGIGLDIDSIVDAEVEEENPEAEGPSGSKALGKSPSYLKTLKISIFSIFCFYVNFLPFQECLPSTFK
jgi:hypothetical protein